MRLITTWMSRSRSPSDGRQARPRRRRPSPARRRRGATRSRPSRAVDDLADVDRLAAPLHPAGLDLGQVEGVVDQRGQPLALLDDDPEVLRHLAHRPVALRVAGGDGREDDLVEPPADEPREADDRGQRRPQLVADARQEGALGRRRCLGGDPGRLGLLDRRGEGRRALDDAPLEGRLLGLDLGVQPGVLDRRGDQAADRVEQRPVARPDVAAGGPVVDRQDADRPALGDQRRARGTRSPPSSGRTPGCARPGPRRRRGRGAARRPGKSWTRWDAVSVERQLAARSTAAVISGLPPTDRPSPRTPRSSSASRIERPIEPEVPVTASSERSSSSSRSSVEPAAPASSLSVISSASRSWRSWLARSERRYACLGQALLGAQRRSARRRAAPPYSTRPAGRSVARTIATDSQPGPRATR